MGQFPECDHLEGHLKAICRGEREDLPLDGVNSINEYRTKLWGLEPLSTRPPLADLISSPSAEQTEHKVPGLMIRGWNFATAIARWTLAGMPRRTQAEIDERLAICQACSFLQNDHCVRCGCSCVEQNRLINKLALTTEKCPEGKWQ